MSSRDSPFTGEEHLTSTWLLRPATASTTPSYLLATLQLGGLVELLLLLLLLLLAQTVLF
jgi:hypothetical protein